MQTAGITEPNKRRNRLPKHGSLGSFAGGFNSSASKNLSLGGTGLLFPQSTKYAAAKR